MPTLFPPLETRDDESVLSAGLKANFEAIQAIVRAQSRLKEELTEVYKAPEEIGNKRKKSTVDKGNSTLIKQEDSVNNPNNDHLESRKLQLAMETAVAAEGEISLLNNGIAELEELLKQESAFDATQIQFPSLPCVVPDELEEHSCDEVGDAEA